MFVKRFQPIKLILRERGTLTGNESDERMKLENLLYNYLLETKKKETNKVSY